MVLLEVRYILVSPLSSERAPTIKQRSVPFVSAEDQGPNQKTQDFEKKGPKAGNFSSNIKVLLICNQFKWTVAILAQNDSYGSRKYWQKMRLVLKDISSLFSRWSCHGSYFIIWSKFMANISYPSKLIKGVGSNPVHQVGPRWKSASLWRKWEGQLVLYFAGNTSCIGVLSGPESCRAYSNRRSRKLLEKLFISYFLTWCR